MIRRVCVCMVKLGLHVAFFPARNARRFCKQRAGFFFLGVVSIFFLLSCVVEILHLSPSTPNQHFFFVRSTLISAITDIHIGIQPLFSQRRY